MVIAHRGYSKVAEENTIEAFDKAILAGAKGIECDIRLTKDEKAVVNHNKYLLINNQKIDIASHSIKELQKIGKENGHDLLPLDDLFEYIKHKDAQFFLEVKSPAPSLVEIITKKIKEKDLWEQVNITGFSFLVNSALKAQEKNPKLQVGQFLNIPAYYYLKYIRRPKKSYSIFLGWLDSVYGSQTLFKALLPPQRLIKLKEFLEKNGFNVKAGVINNDSGLELFKKAGINDIVTDRVTETVKFFDKN